MLDSLKDNKCYALIFQFTFIIFQFAFVLNPICINSAIPFCQIGNNPVLFSSTVPLATKLSTAPFSSIIHINVNFFAGNSKTSCSLLSNLMSCWEKQNQIAFNKFVKVNLNSGRFHLNLYTVFALPICYRNKYK